MPQVEYCLRRDHNQVGGEPCPECERERLKERGMLLPPVESDPNGVYQHAPGAKLDAGKVKAGVLSDFSLALMRVADVGTFGANKYTRGGWQEVPNGIERYTDALWRHLLKERHEPNDPDSDIEHAAHTAWNALAVLELKLREKK